MRPPRVEAGEGVGVRAGPRTGLVLRRHQPKQEPDRPAHPGPHHGGRGPRGMIRRLTNEVYGQVVTCRGTRRFMVIAGNRATSAERDAGRLDRAHLNSPLTWPTNLRAR